MLVYGAKESVVLDIPAELRPPRRPHARRRWAR